MSKFKIETFILGPDETNCYLVSTGSDAVLIDVGMEPEQLIARVEKLELNLQAVFITHFHLDHIAGVKPLLERFDVPVYANAEDDFLKEISLEGGGVRELAQHVDFPYEPIEPGSRTVLGQPMMIFDTPGHTPGSMSYFFPAAGCVFVGDLIFMIAVGRTDLPRASGPELLTSIRSRIFNLPADTRIYSGHGPMTTVTHEKKNNPHFMV
ncbi:MAG: MBL fold metallo-hydrolase [Pseudodesulfovibrio sp.]